MADGSEFASAQLFAAGASVQRLSASPDVISVGLLKSERHQIATARLLGARIRTREILDDSALLRAAEMVGLAFVFRFGVVVTIEPSPNGSSPLLAALAAHVDEPALPLETEAAEIVMEADPGDRIGPDGRIVLADASMERMQLVATVLARSVVLARDEELVSQAFDKAAPVVSDLRNNGRARMTARAAMRLVGEVLAARHRTMGAVQVDERPDLLWDHPALDRLYTRLEAEYELTERTEVLHRKFAALGDFAEALLDIVQVKRAHRLEIAIVALIAFEILINLWAKTAG